MVTIKNMKAGFFDRESVIKAMDKATHTVLNEFGRQVRKTAQASLVYGETVSRPGSPPTAHKSRYYTRKARKSGRIYKPRLVSYLREFLYYAWDKTTKTGVVGPERRYNTGDSAALHALEYGGPSTVYSRKTKSRKPINVRARPFMRPALAKELPKLPPMYRGTVK